MTRLSFYVSISGYSHSSAKCVFHAARAHAGDFVSQNNAHNPKFLNDLEASVRKLKYLNLYRNSTNGGHSKDNKQLFPQSFAASSSNVLL